MIIKGRKELLNYIIKENRYKSYVEVGASNPAVLFDNIKCAKKYSIDPGIECEAWTCEMSENFVYTHRMTSDMFFEQNYETFDLIFIDGLHTDAQCSLDLLNSLRCINEGGSIALHDVIPDNIEMTGDEVRSFGWQGNCWMPVYRLIKYINERNLHDYLEVKCFYLDWGIGVVKVFKEIPKFILDEIKAVLVTNPEKLEYFRDYHQNKMNICYDAAELIHDKVSYFTPLYKSDVKKLKNVYKCLCEQTVDKWEWICYDDTPVGESNLQMFFDILDDNRVTYIRMNNTSGGFIGESKYRAAMMCTGKYLAELDHDDIILKEMTEYILKAGEKYNADFIYTDSAEIFYDMETGDIKEHAGYYDQNLGPEYTLRSNADQFWNTRFGMGYGYYYNQRVQNPVNGYYYNVKAIGEDLNPKTIRHIVGVPNHIRCWKREFYITKLMGHCRMLPIADDYELVVKTVVNDGICVHLNWCGYLQILHENNTTDERRMLIQDYVKAVKTKLDPEIEEYFEKEDYENGDWCKRYLVEHLNNDVCRYGNVPNFRAIYPEKQNPKYEKFIELSTDDLINL